MDRQTVRELLPCFVCGDLPAAVAEQVRAYLHAHPELQAEADAIQGAEDACRELMAELAGELPDLGPISLVPTDDLFPADRLDAADAPTELALPTVDDAALAQATPAPSVPPTRPWSAWTSLLAAAAALVIVVLVAGRLADHPPVDGLLAQHQPFAAQTVDGFISESDPSALMAAFREAGVPGPLAMVADMEPMGLKLLGGGLSTDERLGTVVVYDDGERRYVCQMYTGAGPTDMPVAVRQVGPQTLRAYTDGELSVVVWLEAGMVCLFSAEAPPEMLLAMVEAKMRAKA